MVIDWVNNERHRKGGAVDKKEDSKLILEKAKNYFSQGFN